MITVTTAVISNEWFFTYDIITKQVITEPTFIDSNSSAVIGENVKIEVAQSEKQLLDKISALKLTMPKHDI
ncbi:MAG: hypothetical protein LLF83_08345 [Methanobacterium sp.]|nr:hypothetical protein [Methanobacterium sp.]